MIPSTEPPASRLTLRLLPERLAVCRLAPDDSFPAWVLHSEATVWSVTRTPDELSIVCDDGAVPPSVAKVERPWRAFVIEGQVPFETTGVIAGLTAPLAAAGLPVFVLSTFDTDYLLVMERYFERASACLREHFEVR
ncbi:MAG: ACT domain-containing protein [Candidatus Eisenbacteria bacterium]|uniref:ACT domain-containing protein n=1 Tax=Eiseniibacteriota bacterium TaxID=2212470 RepID=A0A849SFG6_UNCEI|nr:ACT domain-containing protein [Candidatus Eisenbacteria bacterium]